MNKIPIKIVNTISAEQILQSLNKLSGEMCASFDLDEVLICDPDKDPVSKLAFPMNKFFPETIRKNAGQLTSSLSDVGFDVWIYTGKYYSGQYIKSLLSMHGGKVSSVINGVNKNLSDSPIRESFRKKYRIIVHIDSESIIWTNTRTKEYEIIDVKSDKHWANNVFKLIKQQINLMPE